MHCSKDSVFLHVDTRVFLDDGPNQRWKWGFGLSVLSPFLQGGGLGWSAANGVKYENVRAKLCVVSLSSRYDMMKKIIEKSPGCGFNFKTFRLKSLVHFHKNSHDPTRFTDEETDGPMGTDVRTVHCVEMGTTTRSGGGGARALLRRHPTPPREQRHPHLALPPPPARGSREGARANLSPRAEGGVHSRAGAPQVPSRLRETRHESAVGPSRVAPRV